MGLTNSRGGAERAGLGREGRTLGLALSYWAIELFPRVPGRGWHTQAALARGAVEAP